MAPSWYVVKGQTDKHYLWAVGTKIIFSARDGKIATALSEQTIPSTFAPLIDFA
jgi:hypothetical protein